MLKLPFIISFIATISGVMTLTGQITDQRNGSAEYIRPSRLTYAAERVEAAFHQNKLHLDHYPLYLLIEGLIRYNQAEGDSLGIEIALIHAENAGWRILDEGEIPPRGDFSYLPYWIYLTKKDERWIEKILNQNRNYDKSIQRSQEGAILFHHPRCSHPSHYPHCEPGPGREDFDALLIDALQNFTFRMAVTGKLANETDYFREAVEQYRIYHSILRNPETGLWHQGRGWLDDKRALSPGAWSRGHGWLIRGMVNLLQILPPDSKEAKTMIVMLEELAQALHKVQLPSGMWSCLLDRDSSVSPPESSGTALIAGNLALAVAEGWLPEEPYAKVALAAFEVLPDFVTQDGKVLSVSPGPGPLWETEPWEKQRFPPGNEHGAFAIIFASLGEVLLNKALNMH